MTAEGASRETVTVNGQLRALDERRLAELMRALGHDPARPGIAVAVNDEVVPRSQWTVRTVRSGDRIEIVGAEQGG
jgi:sulfur carrier protein